MSKILGVTTEEIMQWALEIAGQDRIPVDSAIYVEGKAIRRVLFGIDVSSADLELGKALGVDLVMAHHPPDALVNFPQIFERHVELMVGAGVPRQKALAAIEPMTERWHDRFHSANYDHVVSVARLLKMPFMNIHNPLDELGRQRMAAAVAGIRPTEPILNVIAALNTLDEIRHAPVRPEVAVGSLEAAAGRIMVVHGAGTNGGYEIAREYFHHGIGTVIYIHLATEAKLKLRQEREGNLIVVGHLPGDLVGIEPFSQLMRQNGLDVIGFSGVA